MIFDAAGVIGLSYRHDVRLGPAQLLFADSASEQVVMPSSSSIGLSENSRFDWPACSAISIPFPPYSLSTRMASVKVWTHLMFILSFAISKAAAYSAGGTRNRSMPD